MMRLWAWCASLTVICVVLVGEIGRNLGPYQCAFVAPPGILLFVVGLRKPQKLAALSKIVAALALTWFPWVLPGTVAALTSQLGNPLHLSIPVFGETSSPISCLTLSIAIVGAVLWPGKEGISKPKQGVQPRMQKEAHEQSPTAPDRALFEWAICRLREYVAERRIKLPMVFISYAWGVREHESWVEKLAEDLQKAGIKVLLDRWHNNRGGSSIPRFIERIAESDRIVVIGTPLYLTKYLNGDEIGHVLAAEFQLVSNRLLGNEERKCDVIPVILNGDSDSALPPLLRGRVHKDFRNGSHYFRTAFELILDLYQISPRDSEVARLHESLAQKGHQPD